MNLWMYPEIGRDDYQSDYSSSAAALPVGSIPGDGTRRSPKDAPRSRL
jgi:hypothetical protein